jgi:hypothetical protein
MQKLIRLLVDKVQHSKPDRLPILLFLYGDHCATYPDEAEKIIEAWDLNIAAFWAVTRSGDRNLCPR